VFSAAAPTGRYLLVYDPSQQPGAGDRFAGVDPAGTVVAALSSVVH
jgi:hypothetical protein